MTGFGLKDFANIADDLEDEILDRAGGLVVGHEVLGRKRRD
jgi:hypothetical protein